MDQARSARTMKKRKEKTRTHNSLYRPSKRDKQDVCCMAFDSSEKRTKPFDVLTGDQELEVRTGTYGPEIDQSQQAKLVRHIINKEYAAS